ncbi:PREDICTED: LINE-1 type transposase domain-containing protein 1 [Rhinopithecus bieti]|uniref:LINE-1 type transposase domain-containing protein 1 n=1 Tax=Rhinopithecus bieti TaxID=61621 RepID=A0A2K6JPY6_RHIBE|nr:PREDICTED: LINE-1 type transposase domain-containing protein 1 [Rhinopithecus bieti]
MSDVSTSVQSKFARLAKKQENITYMKKKQLTETEKDIAPVLDLKCKDVSAIVMNKFKVLMEIQDLMFEEMRETLKSDLKAILGGETTIPEVKNSENSSSRTEFQQIINLALQKTGMLGKTEGENSKVGDDIENLTFKVKEVNELSGKLDIADEYNSKEGKTLPQNESQSYEVLGSMEETLCNVDDRHGNHNVHLDITEGESRKDGEDEFVKDMREERKFQKFENKDILKASREEKVLMDEGAVLTLAANLSSATLNISKQWSDVFNILREHDFEPKFLCEVKLAFKCDGEIKTFSDLQSLRKFASQKSSIKELLKDVLPQKEEISGGGRGYGTQEKRGKTLIDSKHGGGEMTSDGLSFLFLKEVKVAKPEEMNNLEAQEEEFSELEELDEEASGMEDDAEDTSGLEEEEEASGMEEEEEEASGLEEEEEQTSEQDSTFQGHTLVDAKHEVEIISDGMETIFIDSIEDSEPEEKEEGKDSEIVKVKTTSLPEKKVSCRQKEIPFSYLVGDSGKKKLVKHQAVHKTQKEEQTAVPTSQGTGTPCLTLCLASPSESLEIGYDEHKKHSHTNLSISTGVTKLKKTEEKKHRTLHTEELTSKEADLTQETEENLRSSVINSIREIKEEIGNLKSSHPDVLEIKNSVDDLSSRMDILEERIDSLEDQIEEFSKDTVQMTKQMISKERQRDLEDRSRSCNIRLIGIPEKENNENGAEDIIKEIIDENFAELKKGSSLEIVSACRVPSKIDEKRLTPRHILVKFWNSNDKEKIIRASRERREITYQGTRIRLTADLSLDTLDARSKWSNVFKVLLAKGFNPRILYPAKMAFDFRGKTKVFLDVEEFRDYVSHMPTLRELLENDVL